MSKINRNYLLIISGIYLPEIGGPAIFVDALIKFLKKENTQYFLITLSDLEKPFILKNNILKINKKLPKFYRTLFLIYFIFKYSCNSKSILICGLIFEAFIGSIFHKNKKIYRFVGDSIWEKYIGPRNQHDFYVNYYPNQIKLLILLRNLILKKFNLIITPSKYLKKYLTNKINLDENKIRIVSNFAHIDNNLNENSYKDLTINKRNNLKLLTLSRLVKWKNIDQIIKAIKDLENIELDIVGEGPEEQFLKRLALDSKYARINFHGKKNRDFCLKMLNKCDCFIQLSSYEGMSFSILESLKLGKAMLLSNIEPNIETARNAAFYVDYRSKSQIKAAINIMQSKELRTILKKNSISINQNSYSKEKTLEEYLFLMNEMKYN